MMLTIHNEVKKLIPKFKVGVISYSTINVHESSTEIQLNLKEISSKHQMHHSVTDIRGIKEGRQLFKAIGIDPSKYRPSSEALIRRVLKGEIVPNIHSAADVNNLFSLKYALPIGIYDLDQLREPIDIRIGTESESYEAINNRDTNLKGKVLSADLLGPFGSPIVDSKRSMVTLETRNALQIIYFHLELKEEEMISIMKEMKDFFIHHHGGEATTMMV